MGEFLLPSLGADMTEGRLLEWRVKPGDEVHRGDIVALVDTSKAEIEVEIFQSGVIDELLVAEGEKVPVGTVLARLHEQGVPLPATPTTSEHRVPGNVPDARGSVGKRPRISPLARRMSAERGVDLATCIGTGGGGAITKADVERAAAGGASPEAAPAQSGPTATTSVRAAPQDEDKTAAMRHAIANLMARSKREIPHYYLGQHIDLTQALAWLADTNEARRPADRILPAAMLLKAVALACREHPDLNGFFVDGSFRPAEGVHLGTAISLRGGGLVAPAIHDTETLTLDTLMAALRDLTQRARRGQLRGSEMTDPTITVTNLGDRGVETVYGVIYPPQVALVGFGRIMERPWASGGMIGAHPVVHATLAADHRAGDGHLGGLFLSAIDRRLQEPEAL
jgi:pyruvate dehydrogenase E2 component (dihydrolipoamide acetyltransferase)